MDDSNIYVLEVPKTDQDNPSWWDKHIKAGKTLVAALRYQDGTKVEAKVYRITKDLTHKTDDKGEETDEIASGSLIAIVAAPNQMVASYSFLQHKGYEIELTERGKRGPGQGRAKSKIVQTVLVFGKMMESMLFVEGKLSKGFKPTASEFEKKSFNDLFGVGSEHYHYINRSADGNLESWKAVTPPKEK